MVVRSFLESSNGEGSISLATSVHALYALLDSGSPLIARGYDPNWELATLPKLSVAFVRQLKMMAELLGHCSRHSSSPIGVQSASALYAKRPSWGVPLQLQPLSCASDCNNPQMAFPKNTFATIGCQNCRHQQICHRVRPSRLHTPTKTR